MIHKTGRTGIPGREVKRRFGYAWLYYLYLYPIESLDTHGQVVLVTVRSFVLIKLEVDSESP
jgi:hypothetical protein